MNKRFSEVKLFQVKPSKVKEFEELIAKILHQQGEQKGCTGIKYLKRFYTFDTIDNPPRELIRVVKCVKYYSYWEFESLDTYHQATKWFFNAYGKDVMKLLIAPFDINCGELIE